MSLYKTHSSSLSVPTFQISSGGVTHIGKVRTRNEDSILLLDEENVWLVADGMGGHEAGDFASQTIANNLSLFKQQASLEDSILLLEENIIKSNTIIRKKTSQLGKNATIGSTLVCVYLWQNYVFTFWAGDSRLYRFRNDQLQRLTEDHSYVEELVRMGKIDASDAESHPAANVVLKAVGIYDNLCLDFDYFELLDGDIFIVCSDGLYKDLSEEEIVLIIKENNDNMVQLTKSLISASLDAGGTDNTSIVSIKVTQKN